MPPKHFRLWGVTSPYISFFSCPPHHCSPLACSLKRHLFATCTKYCPSTVRVFPFPSDWRGESLPWCPKNLQGLMPSPWYTCDSPLRAPQINCVPFQLKEKITLRTRIVRKSLLGKGIQPFSYARPSHVFHCDVLKGCGWTKIWVVQCVNACTSMKTCFQIPSTHVKTWHPKACL